MKMKSAIYLIIVLAVAFLGYKYFVKKTQNTIPNRTVTTEKPISAPESQPISTGGSQAIPEPVQDTQTPTIASASGFMSPLDRASERVTKKPFGIYITPKTSPVQPERFQGYHTGADFETFPEEQNIDVPVRAVCDGKLLVARTASGYGGVAIESCELNSQPVTVIYGHLNIASVKFKVGDQIKAGEILANLGAGYSAQTDGERKHLHLGFHKGSAVSILGYVQNKADLSGWIDPCSVDPVCK